MEYTHVQVNTFSEKSVNPSVNPENSGISSDKFSYYRSLDEDMVWISSQKSVNLLNISKVAFHKNRKNGKYVTRKVKARGGSQYQVLLSSLPAEAQEKYFTTSISSIPDNIKFRQLRTAPTVQAADSFDPETEAEIFYSAASYNKALAEKKLYLIQQTEHITSRKEIDTWVSLYNEKIHQQGKRENWSEKEIRKLTTSSESVYRYKREYQKKGMSGIIGKHGKLRGRTIVSDEIIEIFAQYSLRGGEPSWTEAREKLKDYVFAHKNKFNGTDYKNLPSLSALKKRLFAVYSKSFIQYMRKGMSWWKRNFQFYIERDYSGLEANQVWVGDHFQVDTGVYDSDGNMIFVWVTAWLDMRTLRMLSWDIHIGASNSDHIFITFRRAVLKYGLPECVYIDNGKDYRTNDFAGGRKHMRHTFTDKEKRYTQTLLGMLKVEVIFAEPYNSQAKVIERMFGIIHREFSRFITGYRGINTAHRPEQLLKDMKAGNLMRFEEFWQVLNEYMEYGYNARPQNGKVLEGFSPAEKWAELDPAITYISDASLALFCSRVVGSSGKPLTIGRNGIKNPKTGDRYWEEWMSGYKGDKVFLRIDPEQRDTAYVFNAETEELIDMAERIETVPAIARTEQEKAWLKQQIHEKKKELKKFKAMQREIENRRHDDIEIVSNMIDRRKAEGRHPETPVSSVVNVKKTKADEYVQQIEEIRKTGTEDISSEVQAVELTELAKKKKRKIAMFESDL